MNQTDFKLASTYNSKNPAIWKDMQAKLVAEHGEVIFAGGRVPRKKDFIA